MAQMGIKGVVLIGGPYQSNQLAPFTSSQPAPLFPIAGVELIYHHIFALSQLKSITHIYLIGLYAQNQIYQFILKCRAEYKNIQFDYLYEKEEKGTAGSLYQFKSHLFGKDTESVILINGDIAHNINLQEFIDFHKTLKNSACTIGAKQKEDVEDLQKYGCIIKNEQTKQLVHYVEKPDNYVSEFLTNTGIYILSPLFSQILDNSKQIRNSSLLQMYPEHLLQKLHSPLQNNKWLSLENDVISTNISSGQIYVYEIPQQKNFFWTQVKSPIDVLRAQKYLLNTLNVNCQIWNKSYHQNWEHRQESVLIDTQSSIDQSADIGPNVVICTGVTIGKGVRIKNSIILEGSIIKDHSFISDSIIGWHSELGYWSRVEGTPNEKVTILGCGVKVGNEVSIRNCVVLKQQYLSRNYNDQYIIC
ncbi:hypothetical protein ABPG72_018459 [Tetrahymena utriculariae]